MAGQAQNQLGQLFVDIGVGGLGQTLKALNSVSASFLLTKNAATQAIKPFIDMGVQATNGAVGIAKMGAALGTTLLEAQKLSWYLRQNNLSESLAGDLGSLSQMFTRIQKGRGGLNQQMSITMGELGLNWQNYDGSAESMFQFVKDVQQKIKERNIPANIAKMYLQDLGLGNAEWFYALQKGDFDLSKSKYLDDAKMKALIEAKEKDNQRKLQGELNTALATTKILEKGGASLQDKINEVYEDVGSLLGDDKKTQEQVKAKYGFMGTKALFTPLEMLFNPFGIKTNKKTPTLDTIKDLTPDIIGSAEAATLPALPNVENKTTINLTNKISGNNVQFEELTATEENSLTGGRQIDVNAYTTHNGHEL